jgi:hypothetical protein
LQLVPHLLLRRRLFRCCLLCWLCSWLCCSWLSFWLSFWLSRWLCRWLGSGGAISRCHSSRAAGSGRCY